METVITEIDYKPRNWAKILHESLKRWIVIVINRRGGKTTAALNHLQRDCIRNKGSLYAYIGPTYKQTKRIAWDIAKKSVKGIPDIIFNESELTVKYPNGSKLFLAGSDNIDALRGLGLWGVALDEYALQSPSLFSKVISKCLADHLGYCIFFGTPKGKNHFYTTYQNALSNPNEWTVIFKTIDDCLRDEEGEAIENLKQALEDDKRLVAQGQMTQDEFDQEWYNSFEAAIKGSYYGKEIAEARKRERIKSIPYDKELLVHTVWDLGVGQALGVGFYQRVGHEVRMIDYWEGKESDGIVDGISVAKNKGYIYGKHFAPHDIRAREESTGKTRLDTASELGIDFEVVPMVAVDDGINKGKLFWGRLWVNDEKCGKWLDNISQYRQAWNEGKNMFADTPLHDFSSHSADVHRYAAIVEEEMNNEYEVAMAQRIQENREQRQGNELL